MCLLNKPLSYSNVILSCLCDKATLSLIQNILCIHQGYLLPLDVNKIRCFENKFGTDDNEYRKYLKNKT